MSPPSIVIHFPISVYRTLISYKSLRSPSYPSWPSLGLISQSLQMLNNRKICIHKPINTVCRARLLILVQFTTPDRARYTFLPANIRQGVDCYIVESLAMALKCFVGLWNSFYEHCWIRAFWPSFTMNCSGEDSQYLRSIESWSEGSALRRSALSLVESFETSTFKPSIDEFGDSMIGRCGLLKSGIAQVL